MADKIDLAELERVLQPTADEPVKAVMEFVVPWVNAAPSLLSALRAADELAEAIDEEDSAGCAYWGIIGEDTTPKGWQERRDAAADRQDAATERVVEKLAAYKAARGGS